MKDCRRISTLNEKLLTVAVCCSCFLFICRIGVASKQESPLPLPSDWESTVAWQPLPADTFSEQNAVPVLQPTPSLSKDHYLYAEIPSGSFMKIVLDQAAGRASAKAFIRAAKVFFRSGETPGAFGEALVPVEIAWINDKEGVLNLGIGDAEVALGLSPEWQGKDMPVTLTYEARVSDPGLWDRIAARGERWFQGQTKNARAFPHSVPLADSWGEEFRRTELMAIPWDLNDKAPPALARATLLWQQASYWRGILWARRGHESGLPAYDLSVKGDREDHPDIQERVYSYLSPEKSVVLEINGPGLLRVETRLLYAKTHQQIFQRYEVSVRDAETLLDEWPAPTAPDTVADPAAGSVVLRDASGSIISRSEIHYVMVPAGSRRLSIECSESTLINLQLLQDKPELFEAAKGSAAIAPACRELISALASFQGAPEDELKAAYLMANAHLALGESHAAATALDGALKPFETGNPQPRLLVALLFQLRAQTHAANAEWQAAIDDLSRARSFLPALAPPPSTAAEITVRDLVAQSITMSMAQVLANQKKYDQAAAFAHDAQAMAPGDAFGMIREADWLLFTTAVDDALPTAQALYLNVLAMDTTNSPATRHYWSLFRGAATWRTVSPDLLTGGHAARVMEPIRNYSSSLTEPRATEIAWETVPEFLGNNVWFRVGSEAPFRGRSLPEAFAPASLPSPPVKGLLWQSHPQDDAIRLLLDERTEQTIPLAFSAAAKAASAASEPFATTFAIKQGITQVRLASPNPATSVFLNLSPINDSGMPMALQTYTPLAPDETLEYSLESDTASEFRAIVKLAENQAGEARQSLEVTLDGEKIPLELRLRTATGNASVPASFVLALARGAHRITIRSLSANAKLLLTAGQRSWTVPAASLHDLASMWDYQRTTLPSASFRAASNDGQATPYEFRSCFKDDARQELLLEVVRRTSASLMTQPPAGTEVWEALATRAAAVAELNRMDIALHDVRAALERCEPGSPQWLQVLHEYALIVAAAGTESEGAEAFSQLTAHGGFDRVAAASYCWWLLRYNHYLEAAYCFGMVTCGGEKECWTQLGEARARAALGEVGNALKLVSDLPSDSKAGVIGALMSACWLLQLGEVQQARLALSTIALNLQLQPYLAGYAQLLANDLDELLAANDEARLRAAIAGAGRIAGSARGAALDEATSRVRAALSDFNDLWAWRSPFPAFDPLADSDVLVHGKSCRIAPLDAPRYFSIYYAINTATPVSFWIQGPTMISVVIRTEQPVDENGDAQPAEPLQISIQGVAINDGTVTASFPQSPAASDVTVLDYANAIPGVKDELVLPVAAGFHFITVEARRGRGFIRLEAQTMQSEEPLLGGVSASGWFGIPPLGAVASASEPAQTRAESLEWPQPPLTSRKVRALLQSSWLAQSDAEQGLPASSMLRTSLTARLNKLAEAAPGLPMIQSLLDYIQPYVEQTPLTNVLGDGTVSVVATEITPTDPDETVREALIPNMTPEGTDIVVNSWQNLWLKCQFNAETRLTLRVRGWNLAPYLTSSDRVRTRWNAVIMVDGQLLANASGAMGEISEFDLGSLIPGTHEIEITRSRMKSTMPLRVQLLVDNEKVAQKEVKDPLTGLFFLSPQRVVRYAIANAAKPVQAQVLGPNTVTIEGRELKKDNDSDPLKLAVKLTAGKQAESNAAVIELPVETATGDSLFNVAEPGISLGKSVRSEVLLPLSGLYTLTVMPQQPRRQAALRLWAEHDVALAPARPAAVSMVQETQVPATGPQVWQRDYTKLLGLTAPEGIWGGSLEISSRYSSRQSLGEENTAANAAAAKQERSLLDTSVGYHRVFGASPWYYYGWLDATPALSSANGPLVGFGQTLNLDNLPHAMRLVFALDGYTQRASGAQRYAADLSADWRLSLRLTPILTLVPGVGFRDRYRSTEPDEVIGKEHPDLRIYSVFSDAHSFETLLHTYLKYQPFEDVFVYSTVMLGSKGRGETTLFSNWRSYTGISAMLGNLVWNAEYRSVRGVPGQPAPAGMERNRLSGSADYYWWLGKNQALELNCEDSYYLDKKTNVFTVGVTLLLHRGRILTDFDPNDLEFRSRLTAKAREEE